MQLNKTRRADKGGFRALRFSHLPAFHFQSSPPVYVIDGSGLGVTEHCERKSKENSASVFSSNLRPTHSCYSQFKHRTGHLLWHRSFLARKGPTSPRCPCAPGASHHNRSTLQADPRESLLPQRTGRPVLSAAAGRMPA